MKDIPSYNTRPYQQIDDAQSRFYSERAKQQRAESDARQKAAQTERWKQAYPRTRTREAFGASKPLTPLEFQEQCQKRSLDHPMQLRLPPNDPLVKRAQWQRVNPNTPYPGDDTGGQNA